MKHVLKLAGTLLVVWFVVMLIGAESVLRIEQPAPGATITNMSDAIWWAVNVCSVGDANIGPVTDSGRFIGVVLILIGYACFTVNVGIVIVVINRFIRWLEEHGF